LIRDYRILSDAGGFITATFGRHKYLPWGVAGGRDGSMNAVEIIHADGRPNHLAGKTARSPLVKGDIARLITGAGGGWGDPRARDRGAVLADLRAELISPETARDVFGLSDEEIASVRPPG
jgi:N-methylhydantoinase B